MGAHRQALESVQCRLKAVLAALDGAGSVHTAGAKSIGAALDLCRRDFDALRALGPYKGTDAADIEEAQRWRTDLEATLRLNAVCIGRVETEVESLTQSLVDARKERRRLAGLRPSPESGGSCDVSC